LRFHLFFLMEWLGLSGRIGKTLIILVPFLEKRARFER